MSYEIVHGLHIENGKVMIKSCSNNVSPRIPRWQEYPYFTRLLAEKGIRQVEIELVEQYDNGNLQGVENRYKRAAHILQAMPEYLADFNWRTGGIGDEYRRVSNNRDNDKARFHTLIEKALDTKPPKEPAGKFIIKLESGYYIYRMGRRSFTRVPEKNKIMAGAFRHNRAAQICAILKDYGATMEQLEAAPCTR